MHDRTQDTGLLTDAARAAGKIALKYWRTDMDRRDKDDGAGPVTIADLEINDMLHDRFRDARPDYGWLSEESEDAAERLSTERVFIVDPIDGTRSFIAGEEGFSVALAIAERGRIVSAAIHLPARDETFSATLGGGAMKNGSVVRASQADELQSATVLAARVQMLPDRWPGGVPPLERHFRSSLAWRLALVAEGRFDSMVTFRKSWEWDIAAGALIAAEAGAHVTNGDGGDLSFNSPEAMQAGIIASAPALHPQILRHRRDKP
ncbi:MAG: 3'(2'),5'-bisphosphate nucleotidase CysQ [Pseudomonadota bacterium]